MITALEIENFKCFPSLRLSLNALTILTGFNGGGKSTAIQPLLLLAQSLRRSETVKSLALNGPLVRLGTVGDVFSVDVGGMSPAARHLRFAVHSAESEADWTLSGAAGERGLRVEHFRGTSVSKGKNGTAHKKGASDVLTQLATATYISAVREGAADAFPIPDDVTDELGDVGADGRYAPFLYDQKVDDEVAVDRRFPGVEATSFRKQIDAWLGALFPSAEANVQVLTQASTASLSFRLTPLGDWRRPANVGYGLTYAFPILVALLVARPGQMIIIDSPEAHLHPSAQSQIGKIMTQFAAQGVQVIAETHSDHFLNGVRLGVKERRLPHSAVAIHFFRGPAADGNGVVSPRLDPEGRINEWPGGFFDQSEKDLALLTEWT